MKRSISGFTIVELLIMIVVIAILASISVVAFTGVQGRARDSARLSKIKDIAKVLELYKIDNGQYPPIQDGGGQESMCGSQTENWGHCDRMRDLAIYLDPYAKFDASSLSNATQGNYYTASPTNSYQTYGMLVVLEGSGGSDGGYHADACEIGENSRYCMGAYSDASANWTWSWDGANTRRCHGGN